MQVPVATSGMLGQSNISVNNTRGQMENSVSVPMPSTNNHSIELSEDRGTSVIRNRAVNTTSTDLPNTRGDGVYLNTRTEESRDPAANVSWHGENAGDGTVIRQLEDVVIVILSFLVLIFSSNVIL